MPSSAPLSVAVAGLGAIGMRVAQALDEGVVPGLRLSAVAAARPDRARARVSALRAPPPVVALSGLADHADVIVECVPAAHVPDLLAPAIEAGRTILPLSVGVLLEHDGFIARAAQTGAKLIVPTGALIGLDTVRAMAVGRVHEVRLETRKPPAGLAGAPYLLQHGIDLEGLREPRCVFEGNAREAARGFPANVNVAAALALAGVGPERTRVEIWADPSLTRNVQAVTLRSDAGEAQMTMYNVPSDENPRTGRIVAQSVIAALARLRAPLTAGS
ncbi:MAG: aspartate dehydrogenase [Pseudomonadota bacterium]